MKNVLHRSTLLALQVDGEQTHTKCDYPHFLLIARVMLHFLADSGRPIWSSAAATVRLAPEAKEAELSSETVKAIKTLSEAEQSITGNTKAAAPAAHKVFKELGPYVTNLRTATW